MSGEVLPEPPLFAGEPANCSLCGEAGHTHDDHWLFQHEPVKALQAELTRLQAALDDSDRTGLALAKRSVDADLEVKALTDRVALLAARLQELERQLGILHESDGRELRLGVTAERVDELRFIAEAKSGQPAMHAVLEALRDALRFYDLVRAAWLVTREEYDELDKELTEANERAEELRCELRRYEPSDAVMYKLLDMQGRLDDAAGLFEGILKAAGEHNAPWDGVDEWLARHRAGRPSGKGPRIGEVEAQLLALHTVIDEGRRLFDRAWEEDSEGPTPGMIHHDTWAAIDEWRNRVLVKEAREKTRGEVARLESVIRELEHPRNAYGLNLAVEQEKTKLLAGAIEQAITWLVTVKADQPASIIADRARLALEALQGVGRDSQ